MYAAIKELVPDAAFTIFTGDIIDHAVWNTSQPYNEAGSKFCNLPDGSFDYTDRHPPSHWCIWSHGREPGSRLWNGW